MRTVRVSASCPYDVFVGGGLLGNTGKIIPGGAHTVAVVSDDTVFPLYGNALISSLEEAGYETVFFVFPHGEGSKNGETFLELLEFLAQVGLTRSDTVAALGGGVVGDVAGFAASAFMRGIRYVQIPTTLLAATDSSVGGKCAIDLEGGKNLAGAFYQPSCVVCDPSTLDTLPADVFTDGCAEVLKYGVIRDEELFGILEGDGTRFDREEVIVRCVGIKADIVARDEFDRGERALLNFGHTFGHGIEAASGYSVTHGKAVAVGMATVARGAAAHGFCAPGTADRIVRTLETLGLPTVLPDGIDFDEVCEAMRSDKKRTGDTTVVIVPEKIGKCISVTMKDEELFALMKDGSEVRK